METPWPPLRYAAAPRQQQKKKGIVESTDRHIDRRTDGLLKDPKLDTDASQVSSTMMKMLSSSSSFVIRRATTAAVAATTSVTDSSIFSRTLLHSTTNKVRFVSNNTSLLKDDYEYVKVDVRHDIGGVGIIQLHRPKALNALSDDLFEDLIHAGHALNSSPDIGCMVLTGSTSKAFAAGADIIEMKDKEFADVYKNNMFAQWADFTKLSKPIIAAVDGYCLGGGCELAMMCDIIVASNRAKFGQPEINLGVIPGAGGTQRLIRAVGKSKAMELILTGSIISATEAHNIGLVSHVYDSSEVLMEKTIDMAQTIASKGGVAVMMAKEAVNAAEELPLQEGLRLERRLFHSLFATHDQKEGMTAFLDKRDPVFTNK